MRFRAWLEVHHSYDNPDFDTPFSPAKAGDTFRVFHGFNSFDEAYKATLYGLSGKYYADRRYSYEADNNPHGLFVTLSLKRAGEFTSAHTDEVIMEFNAKYEDLEAPVWPGGSYTVQGQMAQYFGHGRQGRLKRTARHKEAEKETEDWLNKYPDRFNHVRQSDSKYKGNMLLNSTEYQALFVGDLNPKDVVALHVRKKGSTYGSPFERLTRDEFIKRYKEYKQDNTAYRDDPSDRLFDPDEAFNGEKFALGLEKRFDQTPAEMDKTLSDMWAMFVRRPNPTSSFLQTMGHFLWPRQYKDAFLWMKNRYRNKV